MKLVKVLSAALLLLAATSLRAGELSPEVQAKFIKIIAGANGGRISCSDAALRSALEAQGVKVDGSAMIVWASNPSDARMGKMSGRLVVTGRRDLLSSACILLEEEGGRAKILINSANIRGAKVQVSDAILKVAEKV